MESLNDTVCATKGTWHRNEAAAKPREAELRLAEAELQLAMAEAQLAEAGLRSQFAG